MPKTQGISPDGINPSIAFGVPSIETNLAKQFELQVENFFAQVLHIDTISPAEPFDFLFTYQEKKYAVEVKYYRTKLAQMHLIMRAAEMLQERVHDLNYQPILVVASLIHQQQRDFIKEKFPTLILIDRENLLNTAYHHHLVDNLTPFLGVTEWDIHVNTKDLLTLLREANDVK